jgi:hypothetical protein
MPVWWKNPPPATMPKKRCLAKKPKNAPNNALKKPPSVPKLLRVDLTLRRKSHACRTQKRPLPFAAGVVFFKTTHKTPIFCCFFVAVDLQRRKSGIL